MTISGRFKEHPELLEAFQDEDAAITTACDAFVQYDDGFYLEKPFEPVFITEDSSLTLLAYVEAAAKLLANTLDPDDEDVILKVIGEALQLWETDLCHRNNEWEPLETKPKAIARYAKAVEYALNHRDQPLYQVAELQKVGYHTLVEQIRLTVSLL